MIDEKRAAAALRTLSVATCAAALVACGGGSSNSSGSNSSGSGSSGSGSSGSSGSSSSTGTYTVLYSFGASSSSSGEGPGGLIRGSDGNFYGTTSYGGTNGDGTIYEITPDGTETVLYNFGSSSSDGENPYAGLIQDSDGNFYGTTLYGGTNTSCDDGCGTIFKFSPSSGTETVLYNFGSFSGDGAYPYAGLILDSDGNLYGTTPYGGTNTTSCDSGCGTVFKFSLSSGTETVLYNFGSSSGDGAYPYAGLILDSDGNLYGTTANGGANASCESGCGTVFKVSPGSGTETILYNFGSSSGDGESPYAGLIQDSDGNFYGTTFYGGTNVSCDGGCGTIFKFSPSSGTETILYNFGSSSSDGANPYAGLIQDSDGNFYGTTPYGGTNDSCSNGCGTIFKFSPSSSTETVLYNFGSFSGDGENPYTGVIQDGDGNFYGTTPYGGTAGDGTVFEFTPQ